MHFLELHCQDTENLSSHSQLIQSLWTAVFQGKTNNSDLKKLKQTSKSIMQNAAETIMVFY